jgi:pilus assembly protein Flp/PilA
MNALALMVSFLTGRFGDKNDRGATAVEYGLMVSLIAVAIITTVTLVGTNLNLLFTAVAGAL